MDRVSFLKQEIDNFYDELYASKLELHLLEMRSDTTKEDIDYLKDLINKAEVELAELGVEVESDLL